MSEFVTIQVGQCGNQVGSSLWPLILEEYGISLSGDGTNKPNYQTAVQKSMHSYFYIPNKGPKKADTYESLHDLIANKVKARAVCVDMETGVLSRIKNSYLGSLFDKKCFVSSYPGSGNNWAEGYFEHGPAYKDKILRAIQHTVERCDSLHGFLMLFSVGGGTGSGLGTYILKLLADHYENIERFVSCVYPIDTEDVITCPYNMAFATQELLNHATCVFPVENRALLYILSQRNKFERNGFTPVCKPFEDMNNIIVDMIMHLTSGSRFPGSLNLDMNEINTNMVPFPKLNYLSSGVGSITTSKNEVSARKEISQQIKDEFFWSSCSKSNQLVNHNPIGPKSVLFGATIVGRGAYTVTDMRNYVDRLQAKATFTPWSKKAMKVALCKIPPVTQEASVLSLFNTSAMASLFSTVFSQYLKLYQRKAHAHHYTKVNGFETDHFIECQSSFYDIIEYYRETESMHPAAISRLLPTCT